jgi:hypothetical protein
MQEKLGLGEISCEGFFVEFSVPLREEWICSVATSIVGLLRKSVKMWRRREETMEQALAVIGMSSRAENLLWPEWPDACHEETGVQLDLRLVTCVAHGITGRSSWRLCGTRWNHGKEHSRSRVVLYESPTADTLAFAGSQGCLLVKSRLECQCQHTDSGISAIRSSTRVTRTQKGLSMVPTEPSTRRDPIWGRSIRTTQILYTTTRPTRQH